MSVPASDAQDASTLLASKTDVGQVRNANEDSCDTLLRADGAQLLVVADGMGGHRGGATASSVAVATILETFVSNATFDIEATLRAAIETANARIFEMAQTDRELEGMGTTVVAFVLGTRSRATIAHVGDSRAYRYRQGRLESVTIDHSVVAEMQRRGLISADEAAVHPRRNEILRSVGVLPIVEVETTTVEVAAGDRFVLCSDGLSGVVRDDEIAAVVQAQTPSEAVETLVRIANERGGPDNITVQILQIPASDSEGDPEATAPVEISAIGIEAIESRRRSRKRMRRLGKIALIGMILVGAYLVWQLFGGRDPARETLLPTEPTNGLPAAPLEAEPPAPRRGIPR